MKWYDLTAGCITIALSMTLISCKSNRQLVTDTHAQVHTILQALDTFRFSDVTVTTVNFPVIRDSVRVRDSVVIRTIRNVQSTQMHTQKDTATTISNMKQSKQKAQGNKSNSGWLHSLNQMFHYLVLIFVIVLGSCALCYYFMRHK